MTEEQIQASCFQWHWNTYPTERRMLHHNNNNSVNKIAGNRVKALGVVAGISDFELVTLGSVVFIEMKTAVGSLSSDQKLFKAKVESYGHIYVVIRSLDDFQNFIRKLYGTLGTS